MASRGILCMLRCQLQHSNIMGFEWEFSRTSQAHRVASGLVPAQPNGLLWRKKTEFGSETLRFRRFGNSRFGHHITYHYHRCHITAYPLSHHPRTHPHTHNGRPRLPKVSTCPNSYIPKARSKSTWCLKNPSRRDASRFRARRC